MITDSLVNFIPLSTPLAITTGDIPSTNVIDLLGTGAGTAPAGIIGNRTVFGMDVGIGGVRPQLEVLVTTGFTTSDAATLNIEFQAAIDNGSYQPGSWVTLVETGAIAVANLAAIGTKAARFDFPPAFPESLQPRFLRLLFSVGSGLTFTAGAVLAPVTMVRDDTANRYQPANYSVA